MIFEKAVIFVLPVHYITAIVCEDNKRSQYFIIVLFCIAFIFHSFCFVCFYPT